MRSLPRNSPEAAGRLLALAVMADGHVSHAELEGLRAQHAERRLGLAPGALPQLLHQLCEDLLAAAPTTGGLAEALDDDTVLPMLDEVDDPALQRVVFELAMATTRADGHAAEGELSLLGSMIVRWGLFEAAEVQPVAQALARGGAGAVLQTAG